MTGLVITALIFSLYLLYMIGYTIYKTKSMVLFEFNRYPKPEPVIFKGPETTIEKIVKKLEDCGPIGPLIITEIEYEPITSRFDILDI